MCGPVWPEWLTSLGIKKRVGKSRNISSRGKNVISPNPFTGLIIIFTLLLVISACVYDNGVASSTFPDKNDFSLPTVAEWESSGLVPRNNCTVLYYKSECYNCHETICYTKENGYKEFQLGRAIKEAQ